MNKKQNQLIIKQIKFYQKLFNCKSGYDFIKLCNIKIGVLVNALNDQIDRDNSMCCARCDLPMTDVDYHCGAYCKYCYLTDPTIDL
jgi:hypothetical protein